MKCIVFKYAGSVRDINTWEVTVKEVVFRVSDDAYQDREQSSGTNQQVTAKSSLNE